MGDQPTELDCAAFGILSQIRWNCPDACPGKTLINGRLIVISDLGINRLVTDGNTKIGCCCFILSLFHSTTANEIDF